MTDTRDPKVSDRSYFAPGQTRSGEPQPSRLAHWPPPHRAVQAKPKIIMYPPGEQSKRARPRGWRISRAMFSEFEGDD